MTEDQQALADKLTNLQRLTVLGVVEGKTYEEAYKSADGKAKSPEAVRSIVSRMLTDANVKAFYDSLIADKAGDAILTREKALERLTLMATTQITDIVEFEVVEVNAVNPKTGEEEKRTETIWRMKESAELQARAAASIKSVTMTKMGPKIEMYDAAAATAQIAKMRGWDAPTKVAQTDSAGNDIPPEANANAVLAALARKHKE